MEDFSKNNLKKIYSRNWITENTKVVHIENLKQELCVSELLFKETGNKKLLTGVICFWYEEKFGKRNLKHFKFHSKQLIPVEISYKGQSAINNFLNRFDE